MHDEHGDFVKAAGYWRKPSLPHRPQRIL